jgi:hypothetical protein
VCSAILNGLKNAQKILFRKSHDHELVQVLVHVQAGWCHPQTGMCVRCHCLVDGVTPSAEPQRLAILQMGVSFISHCLAQTTRSVLIPQAKGGERGGIGYDVLYSFDDAAPPTIEFASAEVERWLLEKPQEGGGRVFRPEAGCSSRTTDPGKCSV